MKITISTEDCDACTIMQTEGQSVLITEAYVGPTFVSDDGDELSVCMRDGGFEITYLDIDNVEHVYSLKDGFVRRISLKGRKTNDNVVPFKRR